MPKAGQPPKQVEQRRERLGINLNDIDLIHPLMRQSLLKDGAGKPIVDPMDTTWVDRSKADETSIPFTCDLLTAALVLDLVRSEARKANDPPIRAYIKRATAWERLPHAAVLTVVWDGKSVLSPSIFPEEKRVELIPVREPEFKKITF